MRQIGIFDGKTRFSALVDAAERGETTIITRKGRPVARIGPLGDERREQAKAALERLMSRELRAGLSFRKLIDEGRRR